MWTSRNREACVIGMHFIWKRWRGTVRELKDGIEEYEIIKGYHVRSEKIESETMRYLRVRVMWNSRQT